MPAEDLMKKLFKSLPTTLPAPFPIQITESTGFGEVLFVAKDIVQNFNDDGNHCLLVQIELGDLFEAYRINYSKGKRKRTFKWVHKHVVFRHKIENVSLSHAQFLKDLAVFPAKHKTIRLSNLSASWFKEHLHVLRPYFKLMSSNPLMN